MQIEIKNIEKKFTGGFKLIIDNLEIKDGEVLGLIGNNGAGKTTLLKLMLDLLLPDKGCIISDGFDVKKSDERKAYTGAFIETGLLIPFLTPEEYFYFVGSLHNLSKDTISKALRKYESFFRNEILNKKGKLIRNFSNGNKTKIGIVSSLIFNPKVIILDEPFNGLDPSSQIVLKKIIVEYKERVSPIVIISSHNIEFVTEICTRFLILDLGKVVYNFPKNDDTIEKIKSYFNSQVNN